MEMISFRETYSKFAEENRANMINIENMNFGYGTQIVFRHASLSIDGGGICGLLGGNGAGKTTLMKILLGLLRADGRCSVMGYYPGALDPDFLREVFFVPEDGLNLKISPISYALRLNPFYPNFSLDVLKETLALLEVPENRYFSRMSFGQRKKASISVALSMNTSLLLMDEPTNGLDIPSKVTTRSILLKAFPSESGRRLIISTHQVRDIEDLVNSVAVISEGQIWHQDVAGGEKGGRIDLEKLYTGIVSSWRGSQC